MIDGFDFDDHEILHDEIDSIVRRQCDVLIDNRDRLLRRESKLAGGELDLQTRKVNRFEETRSENAMDGTASGLPPRFVANSWDIGEADQILPTREEEAL
jgi:hypothetical protein